MALVCCSRLHAWWLAWSRWHLCFPLSLYTSWLDFRLYEGSNLKTYLLIRCLGPNALAVAGPAGLLVGFLLLQCSTLCTVESLSLLNLFFTS